MPKKYIDDQGNEVELLTPEEQQAEIDKKAAELLKTKTSEKKEEENKEDKTPSLDEINRTLADIKNSQAQEEREWFNDTVGQFIDTNDAELVKKVDHYFNLVKQDKTKSKKELIEDAIILATKKPISPLNSVLGYNKNSGVPGSKTDGDEAAQISKKFKEIPLPPGFTLSKKQ